MNATASSPLLSNIELEEFDWHFAEFIRRLSGSDSDLLRITAILLSYQTRNGHVCLNLQDYSSASLKLLGHAGEHHFTLPQTCVWADQLRQFSQVGYPGDYCPFILDSDHRLYLQKYWQYENHLAQFAAQRLATPIELNINQDELRGQLQLLFPDLPGHEPDWQRVAAIAALSTRLLVLTGGPGTGKTTTVVKILSLLIRLLNPQIRSIALAAPTGKAAARLKHSILEAKSRLLPDDPLQTSIPDEACTLHRLLGSTPDSAGSRYNQENPLPYDIVVVDEASMIDLSLMSRLTQALAHSSRLILLGDKNQLASVEPGSVFADLTLDLNSTQFSKEFCHLVFEVSGDRIDPGKNTTAIPTNSIITLHRNYRFASTSGISALSRAINQGEKKEALRILTSREYPDLSWEEFRGNNNLANALEPFVSRHVLPLVQAPSLEELQMGFSQFRLLSPLRNGPTGVRALNFAVENLLNKQGILHWQGEGYRGKPLIVTQNDHLLRLYNGEIGFLFPSTEEESDSGQSLQACFPRESGGFRRISPLRLPTVETAYALTVHKSQGSEFEEILLILPDRFSPVLSQELIYTAITRCRRHLTIWCPPEIFVQAISRKMERRSGLSSQLLSKIRNTSATRYNDEETVGPHF
jgi:exodeoxyribonuclease V alpha subunit